MPDFVEEPSGESMRNTGIAGRTARLLNAPYFALLFSFALAAVAASSTPSIGAQSPLAPLPPMGWNSWDAYGTTVREAEVKANADVMASSLKQYGWQYIVVDIQWYEPNAKSHGYREGATLSMDDNGRLIPAVNRFPSSANGEGFKHLADYVHSKGLKFGIHILRGVPRQAVAQNTPVLGTNQHARDIADEKTLCAWNTDMYGIDMSKPGAQAYYDSIVAQYAEWGVDFIKADDMTRPYHQAEIDALHRAILKTGRPIVLSLSPGPAPIDEIADLRNNAQMWRIEDDLWDNWQSVKNMYFRAETWAPLVSPGHWPDADMLPLGHIGIRAERGGTRLSRLSPDEQKTVMTLWSMLRSPLMFGGDLPTIDPFTLSLLTNAGVLAIDQSSSNATIAYSKGDMRVWTAKDGNSNDQYVAVFNLGDSPQTVHLDWKGIGISNKPEEIHELWNKKVLTRPQALDAAVAAHGTLLYRVTVH
jgi:alpha-galactosidase